MIPLAPLTQASLNEMHTTIQRHICHYQNGLLTLDDFLMTMELMAATYPRESLPGLLDPATGLKYPPVFADKF